jgi:hypothetical protein
MGDRTLGEAIGRIREIFGPSARITLWTDYIEIVQVTTGPEGVAAARRVEGYLERDRSARLRAFTSADLEPIAGEFDVELTTVNDELVYRRPADDWEELRAAVAAVAAAGDAAWALVDAGERIDPGAPEPIPALPADAGEVAGLLDAFERATDARPGIHVDAGLGYDVVAERIRESGYAEVTDQGGCMADLEGWLVEEGVITALETAHAVVREFGKVDVPALLDGTEIDVLWWEEWDFTELRIVLRAHDDPMHAVAAVADACRKVEKTFRARVR